MRGANSNRIINMFLYTIQTDPKVTPNDPEESYTKGVCVVQENLTRIDISASMFLVNII